MEFVQVIMEDILEKKLSPLYMCHIVCAADKVYDTLSKRMDLSEDLYREVFFYAAFRANHPLHSDCRAYVAYACHLIRNWHEICKLVQSYYSDSGKKAPAPLAEFIRLCTEYERLAIPDESEITERFLCVLGEDGELKASRLAEEKYLDQLDLLDAQSHALAHGGCVTFLNRKVRAKRISMRINSLRNGRATNGPSFHELVQINNSLACFLRKRATIT